MCSTNSISITNIITNGEKEELKLQAKKEVEDERGKIDATLARVGEQLVRLTTKK